MYSLKQYCIGIALAFFIAFTIGVGFGEIDQAHKLPNCQEDEYLYPKGYTGPGKNMARDYECHSFDELVAVTNSDGTVIYKGK